MRRFTAAVTIVGVTMVALALALLTACESPNDERATTWTWRSLDPGLVAAREGVALGGDARWLVAWGGIDSTGVTPQVLSTGEVLDRRTGRWSPMATSPLIARHHATTTWTSGRLRISGGSTEPNLNGLADLADTATYAPGSNTWSEVEPVAAPAADATTVTVAPSGDRLVATLPAAMGSSRITSSRVPLIATPAGDSVGELAQHRDGRRIDALTSAVDRVRTFDIDDRRWTDGPALPKPLTNAPIGGTIAVTSIRGQLVVITAAQDLASEPASSEGPARWRRLRRPPGTPELWQRQPPVIAGGDIVMVSEPDTSEGAAGRHQLWLLSPSG